MRAFDASAVTAVHGVDHPVEERVRELAGTIAAGASTSGRVGDQFEVLRAATELWGRATETPASVRPVAPTLERALRAPERAGGGATVTDLYVSGVRERRREVVSATLESIAGPALVRGYQASAYPLGELVAALGETLAATSTPVVRKQCVRTLGVIARARPEVVRSTLDADALRAAVEWLHGTESAARWEAVAGAEVLVVALPSHPSVRENAPVSAVVERLLEHDAATPRALAQVLRQRGLESADGTPHASSASQPFPALRRLADVDSADDENERRELARAVGRCVALLPDVVAEAPAVLVERVRMAPRGDRAVAATALGEVVAHTLADDRTLQATMLDRVHAAGDDSSPRRVRVLGEVAVACPDRLGWVPERFRERVAADSAPARSTVRAVGECLVSASDRGVVPAGDDGRDGVPTTDDDRGLDALRHRVCVETGPPAERAAAALGEWVAHVPDMADAPVTSLAAVVSATSEDEREDWTAVLGTYVVAEDGYVGVDDVVADPGSTRAARVRGERALAGVRDDVELNPASRSRVRDARGLARRYATHALGVAVASGVSAGVSTTVALRETVAASPLPERPERLRLLGEWVAAAEDCDRGSGRAGTALAERVRETTGTDRERAARALGLETMERDAGERHAMARDGHPGERDGRVVAEVVARLVVHDEARSATHRAIQPQTGAERDSTGSLTVDVPVGDRDWPVRALGELVALVPASTPAGAESHAMTPAGAESLTATLDAATGWDRQSAARALGVAVLLDAYGPAGLNTWTRTGLAATLPDRDALMYVLGEVAAVHPEQFPGVPDALVASVRGASSGRRTTTARALGEYACQPTPTAPSSLRALGAAAAAASGDTRAALARAVGEVLVAVPDADADVPPSLVDAVATAVDDRRQSLARLLGELAITDDPSDVVDRMAPTSEDDHVFERARRSRMLHALATAGVVTVDALLDAVPVSALLAADGPAAIADGLQNDQLTFDPIAPIRNPLLDALATTLERDAAAPPADLDSRLDAWLRDATDADPTARLHAMAARSTIDTTAASPDP